MRIRDYEPTDEDGWLRCRLLSFLYSDYHMDVKTAKTANIDISLVALDADEVVGILDIETEDALATIDTIAVHPDHARRGIASALLKAAMSRLEGFTSIDAWTREDEAALAWYAANDFVEDPWSSYLHIHADQAEITSAAEGVSGLNPVHAFLHAPLSREAELRERFRKVFVCRRLVRAL
ncbi:acetyltransferase (GNAT) family protein [Stackebrandtia endophytica]|uniref:Acetyltransferase (GNAT) family protein n=1 Tax=Stackebrandtia endophytica TaxID=1496996 RepID=A0A543ASV6_9ACTN|nr:GNAT family N-acetyltransferase [Stackebrandtia endophytica]TQL75669.1 acetyltransferase (GNAT) family protein [Stackebrandtia endophytica]